MNIEDKMKDDNRRYGWRAFLLALFLIVMTMGFVLGNVLFMFRPTESVLEKREGPFPFLAVLRDLFPRGSIQVQGAGAVPCDLGGFDRPQLGEILDIL